MNAMIDIFNDDVFSTVSMTDAIERFDYIPGLLGQLGIFQPKPIYDKSFGVEAINGQLNIIETSARGSKPKEKERNLRDLRNFNTVQLSESWTLMFDSLTGIRELGKTAQRKRVMSEIKTLSKEVMDDLELTREYHRLGALQGLLMDADGTSVIEDYFDAFGITRPSNISFGLNTATTKLRVKCNELHRSVLRSSKGGLKPGAQVHALCGDEWYDKFTSHDAVERTFMNWSAAADLRSSNEFSAFKFGNITWHNYRGTDDNSTVAVPSDQAIVFPTGTKIFEEVLSPTFMEPWINTKGKREYVIPIPDRDRKAFMKGEIYSHPLFMCRRPEVLRTLVL